MTEQDPKAGASQKGGRSGRELGWAVFLASLVVYLLMLNGLWALDHATAFLEFDYAIWSNHTFVLGTAPNFNPHSVDTFLRNGSYYMAAAPGTGIITLPFAALGFIMNGGKFTVFGWPLVFAEISVALCNAFAVFLVYKVGRLYFGQRASALLALAYAFSTISWPFAIFVFQHGPSAMFDLLAAYVALRMARGEWWSPRWAAVCGVAISAAFLTDYVNGVLGMVILGYLVAGAGARIPRQRNRDLAVIGTYVVACVAVGVLLYLAYNWVNFGNPLVSSEEAYKSTGSVLLEFSYPLWLGLVLNTFTPERGIFLFSPFLAVGVLGAAKMLKRLRRDGAFMLAMFLGIFLPYCMWRDPTAGWSFGPRFLIPAMPFLIIPAGFVLEEARSRRSRLAVFGLYAAGAVVNALAALTSAVAPDKGWMVSPFVDSTLPLLRQGAIDSWWNQWWAVGRTAGLVLGGVCAAAMTIAVLLFPAELAWGLGKPDSGSGQGPGATPSTSRNEVGAVSVQRITAGVAQVPPEEEQEKDLTRGSPPPQSLI